MRDTIPQELRDLRQWCVWRYEKDPDSQKETKIPYQIGFHHKIRPNDSSCFHPYFLIQDEPQIAFIIQASDPFCGIDLDDCLTDGELNEDAKKVVDLLGPVSYCEISPSGTGIKLTTRAKKPSGSASVFKCGKQKVEIYDFNRFWTITGDILGDYSKILEGQAALEEALSKILTPLELEKRPAPPSTKTVPILAGGSRDGLIIRANKYLESVPVPGEGNRNNILFKTAGHIWSLVDDYGMSLDQDTIFNLMWSWCGGSNGISEDFLLKRIVNSKSCGKPPAPKPPDTKQQIDVSFIDQWLDEQKDQDVDESDEEYIASLVPSSGMIRDIFDYYDRTAHLFSPIIGMATAISFLQTLFGRKIQSDSGMRTNDYHVVLADSGVGKEMCEKTIVRILSAAGNLDLVCPAGVQSGNGLLSYLAGNPCSLWIKDEFGMYLEGVFGKKKQPMEMQVGRLLLELYGKSDSRYSGNAHAAGKKHEIDQPHLCLLGLSTFGTLFANIDYKEVESGLFSRICWWAITERTQLREDVTIQEVPSQLVELTKKWIDFRPETGIPLVASPTIIPWSPESKDRWKIHLRGIRSKQETETTGRAAIWSRVAARSIKLALIHCASRLIGPEEINQWSSVRIQMEDIDWGIKVSNWLARTSCNLALNNTTNINSSKAQIAILEFVRRSGDKPVKLTTIQRSRSMQKNELMAAALILEREGKISITRKPYGSKEHVSFRGLSN